MVNYGVSRGCDTCKKRRKKCDGTRPACNRCLKSRRPCPGYKDEATLLFRHYGPSKDTHLSPIPWWSPEVLDEQLEEGALGIFITEFVVEASDRKRSRGFLDGMPALLASVDAASTLVSAAKLLALVSIANRTGREDLVKRAQRRYGILLKEYHDSLSQGVKVRSLESLFTAVLLGIYEIVASNEQSPAQHLAHVHGTWAIIRGGVLPLEPEKGVEFSPLGNPLLLKSPIAMVSGRGVLCAPISHTCLKTLDGTLIKFSSMFDRAQELLSQLSPPKQELLEFEVQARVLDEEFRTWGNIECNIWAPKNYGSILDRDARVSSCQYCCTGPVDTYFDYYIAAVWNIWRKAQMLLLDALAKVSRLIGRQDLIATYEQRAQTLAAGIKASIPYHLAADLDEYLRLISAGVPLIPRNRPVGGLLLLHPLYAAASCTVIPLEDRAYFLDCLSWIGQNMGIGQATLLANWLRSDLDQSGGERSPRLPFVHVGEGHILIWASMMLQPVSDYDDDEEVLNVT